MAGLDSIFAATARELADVVSDRGGAATEWLFGTVVGNPGGGALDVSIDGSTVGGVRCTADAACAGPGRRCVVMRRGPLLTVVGLVSGGAAVDALPVTAGGTGATTAAGALLSLSSGTDMVRSALDGTPGCAAAWGTGEGITATDSGVRIAGTWGTASAAASAVSRASSGWWDAPATATADHARAVELSADVTLNAALDDTAAGTTRAEMGLSYLADGATSTTSVYGCRLWLAGKAKGTYAMRGRLTLPAGATVAGILVQLRDYGDAVDLTFSDVHWRVSPAGLGGENLMAGTAGFSALTGGTWAAGSITPSNCTLSHAHDPDCPVPDSDCVTMSTTADTTATGIAGFGQRWDGAALPSGERATMSLWCRASADGAVVDLTLVNGSSQGRYVVGTSWTRLTFAGSVPERDTWEASSWFVKLRGVPKGTTLQVCGLKVERGEVASAWSPNTTTPVYGAQHKTNLGMYLTKNPSEYNALSTGTWTKMGVVFRCNS